MSSIVIVWVPLEPAGFEAGENMQQTLDSSMPVSMQQTQPFGLRCSSCSSLASQTQPTPGWIAFSSTHGAIRAGGRLGVACESIFAGVANKKQGLETKLCHHLCITQATCNISSTDSSSTPNTHHFSASATSLSPSRSLLSTAAIAFLN